MFKHVLIPTDGSVLTASAIKSGIAVAKAFGAKVSAIRTFPPFTISPYGEFGPNDDVAEQEYRERCVSTAESDLAEIGKAAVEAGLSFDKIVLQEKAPWKAIVDEAQARGCDLICMASHGRSGIAGILIGSETSKVLTHTKIPVLVCR
jgi:nucleotide-binding universal stress UspA family protein